MSFYQICFVMKNGELLAPSLRLLLPMFCFWFLMMLCVVYHFWTVEGNGVGTVSSVASLAVVLIQVALVLSKASAPSSFSSLERRVLLSSPFV